MKTVAMLAVTAAIVAAAAPSTLTMTKKGGYASGATDPLEIIVAKPSAQMLFVTSITGLTILQVNETLGLEKVGFYDSFLSFGYSTSVAYGEMYDELAIAVGAADKLTKGRMYIVSPVDDWVACNFCENYVSFQEAGYLPDMVTFTPDGNYILSANEGEPVDYTTPENDPVGSISIFERADGYTPCEASFERYDEASRTSRLMDLGVRKTGANFTSFAQDMEPEYIAVAGSSKWAYVTLQENNAVAKVDIEACRIKRIFPLGYKEWGDDLLMDASDKDLTINMAAYPMVKGMYMPDAIRTFRVGDIRYFLIANEGDAREYGTEDEADYYLDEARVADLAAEMGLNTATGLYSNAELGRLKVTSAFPYTGDINELYAYGGRSISIFNNRGEMVWDSGDFMESYIADSYPDIFNAEGSAATFDTRSDDKGIEPEGLAIAEIDDRLFVFVALERVGGFMCWDITDPTAPVFQSYVNSNDEDISPESAEVIPAEYSPSGKPLLVAAYEVSNTVALFEIDV